MPLVGDFPEQSESGIDLTLVRSTLQLPLEARLRHNAGMVRFCVALQQANPQRGKLAKETFMVDMNASEIVKILVENQVEFILIGGLAMIFHGSSHVTKDVDVCYNRTVENIRRLAAALAPVHPYLRGVPPGLPFRFDPPTIQAGLNFTLDTDLGPLDLLGEVKGLGTYDQVVAQSRVGDFLSYPIQVLSIDGLLLSKKAAGRFKDQSHVLELEELKKILAKGPPGADENVSQ